MTSSRLDAYDRRTRLRPALLSALPLALSVMPLAGWLATWWTATVPVLVYCGGAYLLAQLVRDRGKWIEARLWLGWGGAPTTRLLRHRGAPNPVTVVHRHARLGRLLPHLRFPSPAEEAADPEGADNVYETAVKYLLDATRDNALLFKENCNYGFRRNLLGLRSWGVSFALLGVGLVLGTVVADRDIGSQHAGALAIDALALALWAFVVKSSWVKIAADAYAERLLGAGDQIAEAGPAR